MNKPTVYLDASIISAYWDKAKDVSAAARREKTRDWWEYERRYFESSVSEKTVACSLVGIA